MLLRIRQSLTRTASPTFIVLCFVLLLGGLAGGTVYILSTIKPVPVMPQVHMEQIG